MLLESIAYCLLVAYGLFSLLIFAGWWRARFLRKKTMGQEKPASILIPCRNEEKRISGLVISVKMFIDTSEGSEFIFIDDHSEDETAALLEKEFEGFDFDKVRVLRLPAQVSGKKAALTHGISNARFGNIVTIDADCELTPAALHAMLYHLSEADTQMVCGPVYQYSGKGFGGRLADLEFLSLVGSGISFWGLGMSFLANGAFLGFKKKAFESVNGFEDNEQFPGGDDVFLLQKIAAIYGEKAIYFLTEPTDIISTKGDQSLSEFLNRRIRWGMKVKAYTSTPSKIISIFVLFVNIIFVLVFLLCLLEHNWHILWTVIAQKLICDFLVLFNMIARFRKWHLTAFIFPASLLHPFYILFAGVLSLVGKYHWKQRKYGKTQ